MGFLTNVSISNDFWHEIAKDPAKLVEGIQWAMNYGTNSPLTDTFDAKHDSENHRRHRWEMRQSVPQGVTVHNARHYDEPQVIVNTWGTQPVNAAEIPYAIQQGWLDLSDYNKQHAERIAATLEHYAEEIRDSLKATDKAQKLREEDDRFRDSEHRDESLEVDDGVNG